MFDVIVIGAGPLAWSPRFVLETRRANTALITRDEFGTRLLAYPVTSTSTAPFPHHLESLGFLAFRLSSFCAELLLVRLGGLWLRVSPRLAV